ncbi:MAG: hypothetical protein HQM06_11330 [Magnetococcales bacterium]|nr:hypothetical protein [Magnetococcales bacterium]
MSVTCVLLCEDQQTERFIKQYLLQSGWNHRDIRTVIRQHGKGAAEQWVRQSLPAELKAMRSKQNRVLIVGTDADKMSVTSRIQTLIKECKVNNVAWIKPNERVLLIIPKRNIETWIAFLHGASVDEEKDYQHHECLNCKPEIAQLKRMCQTNQWPPAPPSSLLSACSEFNKL